MRIPTGFHFAALAAFLITPVGKFGGPVIALNPVPHVANCYDFHEVAADSWHSTGPVQVNNETPFGSKTTITAGTLFGGIDIGRWLNTHCVSNDDQDK